MATLTHVNEQWRNRPAHERFYDVADIIEPLERRQRGERFFLLPMDEIGVTSKDEDIYLTLPRLPAPVRLNHWSFQRLADQIDVSANDLRKYPAKLVTPILEHALKLTAGTAKNPVRNEDTVTDDDEALRALYGDEYSVAQVDSQSRQLNILTAPNGEGLYARSIDSATYGRYRDLQLARDAMLAVEQGWRTPRAMAVGNDPRNRIATVEDEMKCSLIQAGMQIGPAGVYLGDRNLFIFLTSDKEVLPGHFRFVTLENSEVGESRKLCATFGLMNYVCMNHILWGVSNVHRVEKKHRRGAVAQFTEEFAESLELVSRSEGIPTSLYALAKTKTLGPDKDSVVKAVYSRRIPGVTQTALERAWDCAVSNPNDADGAAPNTYWGFTQGFTRYSQSVPYADKRMLFDRAAGSLLDELKEEDGAVTVQGSDIPGAVETMPDGNPVIDVTPAKRGRKSTK